MLSRSSGVSYVGNQVYLFLTGPNLPLNGVTLSDITQRADQGYFTIVPLDSNQQWSYKWDTRRLKNQIDPGAYTIYVTTDPVDLSRLSGSSTFKTLEVDVGNANAPQGESGPGTYTLNPEKHTNTQRPTTVMGSANVTPALSLTTSTQPTVITTLVTMSIKTPELTPTHAMAQAGLLQFLPYLAVAFMVCILFVRNRHP